MTSPAAATHGLQYYMTAGLFLDTNIFCNRFNESDSEI